MVAVIFISQPLELQLYLYGCNINSTCTQHNIVLALRCTCTIYVATV